MAEVKLHYEIIGGRRDYREYKIMESQVGLLPSGLVTGSSAYCIDTQNLYMYEESTDKWYKQ